MKTASPSPAEETAEQLALLENSQSLMSAVILGLALHYRALQAEKSLLLGAPSPDPLPIQAAASLIIIAALAGFQQQARVLAQKQLAAGQSPDMCEININATVLSTALLRLFRLLSPDATAAARQESLLQPDF